jgi:hypothetical protein
MHRYIYPFAGATGYVPYAPLYMQRLGDKCKEPQFDNMTVK